MPQSVKINNCTNEEQKGIVCALLAWRKGTLEERSLLSELGKKGEKNILLFIIGKFCQKCQQIICFKTPLWGTSKNL